MPVVLHLTVSKDGFITLWDRPRMGGHGVNVELQLTDVQEHVIRLAMRRSRQTIGAEGEAGPYIRLRGKVAGE